jgi:6-pyruvoyltetrahydropterin/6-carboxytetrahydropterin synthase
MDHPGNCSNLHGHSYKVEVTVGAKNLNNQEMIIDFSHLKAVVGKIISLYDHCVILEINDPLFKILETANQKMLLYCTAPTAENMSYLLAEEIKIALLDFTQKLESDKGVRLIKLEKVTVWETRTNSATWTP